MIDCIDKESVWSWARGGGDYQTLVGMKEKLLEKAGSDFNQFLIADGRDLLKRLGQKQFILTIKRFPVDVDPLLKELTVHVKNIIAMHSARKPSAVPGKA